MINNYNYNYNYSIIMIITIYKVWSKNFLFLVKNIYLKLYAQRKWIKYCYKIELINILTQKTEFQHITGKKIIQNIYINKATERNMKYYR